MFFPFPLKSCNQVDHLSPGTYEATAFVYFDQDAQKKVIFSEYKRETDEEPSACDLVVIEKDGVVLMRDFLKMDDYMWRDSFGQRAINLISLIPDGLLTLPFMYKETVGTQFVGESNGQ